jgi:hypothetical protein
MHPAPFSIASETSGRPTPPPPVCHTHLQQRCAQHGRPRGRSRRGAAAGAGGAVPAQRPGCEGASKQVRPCAARARDTWRASVAASGACSAATLTPAVRRHAPHAGGSRTFSSNRRRGRRVAASPLRSALWLFALWLGLQIWGGRRRVRRLLTSFALRTGDKQLPARPHRGAGGAAVLRADAAREGGARL